MNTKKLFKVLLTITGAILIGALGSGVWEAILKPFFSFGRDFVLNVATLGIQSFKNSIYQDISLGFYESPSIKIFTLLLWGLALSLGYLAASVTEQLKECTNAHADLLRKTRNLKQGIKEQENTPIEQDYQELDKLLITLGKKLKLTKISGYAFLFVIFLSFTLTLEELSRVRYVNTAIAHYRQLLAICQPYTPEDQVRKLNSAFSQISSKDDYVRIINDLNQIALQNNQRVPKFNIW